MIKRATVTESTGNVFADIGLPDAASELVKAQLTFRLANHIKALGLTQTAAAQRLAISQPDVSRLIKCLPTGFSTDRLLAMLSTLNVDIDIVLRSNAPQSRAGNVRVIDERKL